MDIIIMGLGAVGLELAESLSAKNGINVAVVDTNPQKVEEAVDRFDVLGVVGNGGIVTSISSVATCLNNVGPGLAGVGPVSNFADLTIFSKIVLCFDMLIGRLEILPILLIFYPKARSSI